MVSLFRFACEMRACPDLVLTHNDYDFVSGLAACWGFIRSCSHDRNASFQCCDSWSFIKHKLNNLTTETEIEQVKYHNEILMDVTSLDGHPNLRTNMNIMNLKRTLLTFELSFLVLKFMRLQTDVRRFLPSKGVSSKRFQDVTITFNGKCVIKRYSLMMHHYHMPSIYIFGWYCNSCEKCITWWWCRGDTFDYVFKGDWLCLGTMGTNERIWNEKALEGNMDPCVLHANETVIESEVGKMLDLFGTRGYIPYFGHGCFPDMDPKHVDRFIKSVQQKSFQMNEI